MKRNKKISAAMRNKMNKVNNIMLFGVVVCCASPFLYFAYLYMKLQGGDIYGYIQTDAYTLINMIAAFINPFAGLMIDNMRKKANEFQDPSVVYRNLFILLIGEICMLNTFYIFLLVFILYKLHDAYNEPFNCAWKSLSFKKFVEGTSGSFVVLAGYLFVDVLLARIMFFA